MTDKAPATRPWLPCHCCGRMFPAENLVNFHDHPDDALCVTCLEWLRSRARPIARRLYPMWQMPARIRAARTRRSLACDQAL